jgi:hypothetical protein
MDVRPVTSKLAREVAELEHYMHRKPVVSHAFGLYDGPDLAGICVYGTPASRHLQLGAFPSDPGKVLELNRLWVHDRMPRNTESWFVSRTLRALGLGVGGSYGVTLEGDMGIVARALNFEYGGWTDMERKTARYDYIPHDPRCALA